jgi:cytochrome c-type biogenesis protein CcmE
MNKKYILGGIVVVVFLVVTIVLFMQSSVQYEEDLTKVMAKPKTVKAAGHWVKAKGCDQDNQAKTLSFIMADDQGHEMPVKFKGVMPNNFEVAQKIVVTGKFENGTFHATDILTKCPSKYQDQKSANS